MARAEKVSPSDQARTPAGRIDDGLRAAAARPEAGVRSPANSDLVQTMRTGPAAMARRREFGRLFGDAAPRVDAPLQAKGGVIQMVWWEKVGDTIVKHDDKKPGGYRLVRGLKSETGESVYESAEQKKANTEAPKTYAEELGVLPTTGEFLVPSHLIRYSQDSIGKTFSDGKSIHDTASALKKGTLTVADFNPLRVLMSKGDRLVSLDNRRLWCCKEAGVAARCVWATKEAIENEASKFTSSQGANGSTLITVRK